MMHLVRSASEVLLLLLSFYGWGGVSYRLAYGRLPTGWAYPAALGIAVLIGFGGILNAVHLAKPPALLALLAIGVGLAAIFAFRFLLAFRKAPKVTDRHSVQPAWNNIGNAVFYALLLAVIVFLALTLMPTRSFNYADDFHVYLNWIVRMLQTGSLSGNRFDQLGFISLGSQAFLQGMYLTFGSIADINGFDAILCLILSLGLLREVGERLGVRSVFILAACLLALTINPQYVNVSSLYSGTLMLLGLFYGTMLLPETFVAADSRGLIRTTVPCALFFAALLSLKTTFVFLAPLFWAASLAGSLLLFKERRRVLRAHVATAVFSIAFLLPWLLLYLDRYIRKIHYLFAGIHYPNFGAIGTGPGITNKVVVLSQLFSNKDLFWGGNYRDFLYVDIMLLAALVLSVWVAWRRRDRPGTRALLLPFLVLLVSIIGNYICYYKLVSFRADQVIRYSCPILIGAAPLTVLLAGWLLGEDFRHWQKKEGFYKIPLVLGGLLLCFQIAIAGFFGESFLERVSRAYNFGTLLSYPYALTPLNLKYNKYVLSAKASERISFIQSMVPPGQSILVWMSMPIYMDYRRNKVFATSEYGISNPLLVMPLKDGVEGMRQYFRKLGIRYFIWQYRGMGMKRESQLGAFQKRFQEVLGGLASSGRGFYNDGEIVAFDIGSAGS